MTLLKYSPFADVDELPGMRQLQESINRIFEPGTRPWTPPVDIREDENALVLDMDVPGVDLGQIDIRLENDTLTVKGQRKFESESKGKGFHRIERSYGAFARSFTLPNTVETEKVRADYKNGVLSITLPKKEVAKPRAIKVEIANEGQVEPNAG
jgi:HSP20 family protein